MVQVHLRVIREGMEGNTVSAHNVHKVGHIIIIKQQMAQYGAYTRVFFTYYGLLIVYILSPLHLPHVLRPR